MQQEKEKHLDFLINETTRSHATKTRVEVCAHLAITKKNKVLIHFDPIKDSNMVYRHNQIKFGGWFKAKVSGSRTAELIQTRY